MRQIDSIMVDAARAVSKHDLMLKSLLLTALILLAGCAEDPELLDIPPIPGYNCVGMGDPCDLPGVCCPGLLCVGDGVCAPVNELTWDRPDAGPECVAGVLVDASGSMSYDGQLAAVREALELWADHTWVLEFGERTAREPTWDQMKAACTEGGIDQLFVITDEEAQGGSAEDTQEACGGIDVHVWGEVEGQASWPEWTTWHVLFDNPNTLATSFATVCR